MPFAVNVGSPERRGSSAAMVPGRLRVDTAFFLSNADNPPAPWPPHRSGKLADLRDLPRGCGCMKARAPWVRERSGTGVVLLSDISLAEQGVAAPLVGDETSLKTPSGVLRKTSAGSWLSKMALSGVFLSVAARRSSTEEPPSSLLVGKRLRQDGATIPSSNVSRFRTSHHLASLESRTCTAWPHARVRPGVVWGSMDSLT